MFIVCVDYVLTVEEEKFYIFQFTIINVNEAESQNNDDKCNQHSTRHFRSKFKVNFQDMQVFEAKPKPTLKI